METNSQVLEIFLFYWLITLYFIKANQIEQFKFYDAEKNHRELIFYACSQKHVSYFQIAGGSLFILNGEKILFLNHHDYNALPNISFHSALVYSLLQYHIGQI
jgi:hypothetical protein